MTSKTHSCTARDYTEIAWSRAPAIARREQARVLRSLAVALGARLRDLGGGFLHGTPRPHAG